MSAHVCIQEESKQGSDLSGKRNMASSTRGVRRRQIKRKRCWQLPPIRGQFQEQKGEDDGQGEPPISGRDVKTEPGFCKAEADLSSLPLSHDSREPKFSWSRKDGHLYWLRG